jgi:hypothetical protein
VNSPFICSNITTAPAYEIYISQLFRYSRACDSYQDFLDRGLLLTRKLLNQLAKLKWSFRKFYGRHHNLVNRYGIFVSQMTTGMFHWSQTFPGPFLRYDTTDCVTWRAPLVEQELPTLPDYLSSPPVFSGVRVARSLVYCVVFSKQICLICLHCATAMFCRWFVVCPFVVFILAIVLSVFLRFTESDYPLVLSNSS